MFRRGTVNRVASAVTATVAAGALLAACSSSPGAEQSSDADQTGAGASGSTEVRVAFIPNANHLPLLVAADEGFFEEQGLDVTLNPVQNLGALAGAMGKQYDLGSSTIPDVIIQQQQGLDLVLATNIAVESSARPTVGVFVAADSPITDVSDLEGKTLAAATLGGNLHPSVMHWLYEGGVDLDSVTVTEVPFPNMADQLAAGRVDAVESLEPFRGQLVASGARELVDPLTEVADPVSFVSLMATAEWVADNPDTLTAFNTAMESAIEFIGANEGDARAILATHTELPEDVVANVPLPDFSTELPRDEVGLWAGVLADIGRLEGDPADVDPAAIIP